jgi:hypothetical protein
VDTDDEESDIEDDGSHDKTPGTDEDMDETEDEFL